MEEQKKVLCPGCKKTINIRERIAINKEGVWHLDCCTKDASSEKGEQR